MMAKCGLSQSPKRRVSALPNYLDPRCCVFTLPPQGYEGGCDGWELIAERLAVNSGIVAVVPDREPDKSGLILLPDNASSDRKPDFGTVVSSGEPDLKPGDRVLYAPWAGSWFRPFVVGGYKVPDLRFYGLVDGGDPTKVVREPLEDILPCKVESRTLKPIRDVVVLRRDPLKHTTRGGFELELSSESKARTLKATVVAAGPLATLGGRQLEAGMRVIYSPSGLVLDLTSLGAIDGWFGDAGDYALIRSGNLFAVIEDV